MTLAIGVVVGDGVALAADSRTTEFGQPMRVLSDFTHKVFKLGNVAVATYGYALLQGRNIGGHISEFSAQLNDENPSAAAVAEGLGTFFVPRFTEHVKTYPGDAPPAGVNPLGFLVGGNDGGVSCLHEVTVPDGKVSKLGDSTTGTAVWRGQTDVIARVVKGIDLAQLELHAAEKKLTDHVQALRELWPMMEYAIPLHVMNLQDAVDFAVLAIRTTIDVQRLTHGTIGSPGSWPGVGGPIELATVTPASGFQWLQQTHLQAERPGGVADR